MVWLMRWMVTIYLLCIFVIYYYGMDLIYLFGLIFLICYAIFTAILIYHLKRFSLPNDIAKNVIITYYFLSILIIIPTFLVLYFRQTSI